MIGEYWAVVLMVAGALGAFDYPKLAWITVFIAGLLSVLPM